jgi:thioesterase domain-containing protein/acyl carrier protein
VQTHRLVLHRVLIDVQSFGIGRDDRLTLLSSPSYSNSLRHVFGALLNGATLCPFNLVERGAAEFIAWLERERITIYDSVPAVFRRWTSALPHTDALRALRVLHLGGDGPTAADFEMFRTHVPDGCRFVTTLASNEAGPFRRFLADRTTQIIGDVVPVGYAVDDKDVLIVDDDGRALDANRVGEIVVSSAFLSPGYWGRPDLTAAAFRPDPRDPQKRVYRTGDLGAIRPDGCLLFKGRKESRTKIRGVRVEIAEIEAALGAHPNVDRSIVVARQQAANEDSLVAYVVTTTGAALTVSELRHFLAARVPNQSIPSAFVFLHELPLGPNGKVDRLALPAPDGLRPQLTTRYAAPQDALERRLAATCEAVLGIRPIGVHDNLLDLGADSLTLLQLTARIEDEFGTPLPPASLFAAPTLAKLATKLRTGSVPARCSSLVPVTTTGHRTPFFWIHGDYSTALLPGYLGADQPLYAFEHQSQDGTAAEHTEVETIAAYYAAAMRAVQAAGPYLIGGYSFGGVLALEIAHQLTSEGERVALLALLDPPSLLWSRWTNPIPVETASSGPESITHRVRRHLNGLGSLSAGERVEYFRSRIWEKSVDHLRQIQRQAYTAIYRAHFMLDLRLPRFVRRPYVFDLYGRAYGRYAVRPYSGPAILFKGEGRRYYSAPEWDELLTGPREVHRLATAHNDMPSKKNIHLWAETLTRALARAQAENAVK